MKTIAERLKWAMENRTDPEGLPWTGRSLARAAKLSEPHVGMILRGESKNPRGRTIHGLAQTLQVPASWLQKGVGKPMTPFNSLQPASEFGTPSPPESKYVVIRAGDLSGWNDCVRMVSHLFPEIPAERFERAANTEIRKLSGLLFATNSIVLDVVLKHGPIPRVGHASMNARFLREEMFGETPDWYAALAIADETQRIGRSKASADEIPQDVIDALLAAVVKSDPIIAAAFELSKAKSSKQNAGFAAHNLAGIIIDESKRRDAEAASIYPLMKGNFGLSDPPGSRTLEERMAAIDPFSSERKAT